MPRSIPGVASPQQGDRPSPGPPVRAGVSPDNATGSPSFSQSLPSLSGEKGNCPDTPQGRATLRPKLRTQEPGTSQPDSVDFRAQAEQWLGRACRHSQQQGGAWLPPPHTHTHPSARTDPESGSQLRPRQPPQKRGLSPPKPPACDLAGCLSRGHLLHCLHSVPHDPFHTGSGPSPPARAAGAHTPRPAHLMGDVGPASPGRNGRRNLSDKRLHHRDAPPLPQGFLALCQGGDLGSAVGCVSGG